MAETNHGTMEPGTHPTNDELTVHAQGAGVWGSPMLPRDDPGAELPTEGFDYSAGMFAVVPMQEADAVPGTIHEHLVARLPSDVPPSYQVAHEATHRRFEAPFPVAINQAAAGFTLLAPPRMGLHYIKLLGAFITLSAAGTLRFQQGATDGTQAAPITGDINLATAGGFVLPTADTANPWFFTSSDQALSLFTATGLASGWVMLCYSPYEA
jgi:hypothetical protein